jgi:UDP-glucose 4-epimerase
LKGNILVTGGAGFIGSHTVRKLKESGYSVYIYDNLSSGHKDAIKDFTLIEGDLADIDKLNTIFEKTSFDGVIHFAGSIEAGESMTDPRRFYQNNVVNALNLANAMVDHGVKKIVFSSSAAVYGEPEKNPIEEGDPKIPTNYYGLTKLMFEQILESYDHAYGIKSVSLRYFNAAGADPSGEIGADHKHKTHLITLVMLTALGKRDSIKIFGTDFPTPDGTGIRDYVHVNDLADAHVLALEYLEKGGNTDAFNLGNEKGNSVKEVIEVSSKVSGKNINAIEEERRDGDPAKLVASSQKAKEILGWNPKFDNIEDITRTAWGWHSKNPDGYKD